MEVVPFTDQLRISKLVGGGTGGAGAESLPQFAKRKILKIDMLTHFIMR